MTDWLQGFSTSEKVFLVVAVAVCAHVLVRLVRYAGSRILAAGAPRKYRKTRTVATLVTSSIIFALYLGVIGYAFFQFGISLTGYIASVSVVGLALAFGSQGLVQDMVTGLTIIFTDLFDVGDLVEIGGQVGLVEKVGIRFTVLENPLGAKIFLPNRTIGNVITYQRSYIRCNVDVTLSVDTELRTREEELVRTLTQSLFEQFPRIHRAPLEVMGTETTSSGRTYIRVKMRIWPGRGGPIETSFKQELLAALKALDPAYQDWMVAINFEVERDTPVTDQKRFFKL